PSPDSPIHSAPSEEVLFRREYSGRILTRPEFSCSAAKTIRHFRCVRLPRVHCATELGTAKESDNHLSVIRHGAPGDQSIALSVKVPPGADRQLSDRGLAQQAFA